MPPPAERERGRHRPKNSLSNLSPPHFLCGFCVNCEASSAEDYFSWLHLYVTKLSFKPSTAVNIHAELCRLVVKEVREVSWIAGGKNAWRRNKSATFSRTLLPINLHTSVPQTTQRSDSASNQCGTSEIYKIELPICPAEEIFWSMQCFFSVLSQSNPCAILDK